MNTMIWRPTEEPPFSTRGSAVLLVRLLGQLLEGLIDTVGFCGYSSRVRAPRACRAAAGSTANGNRQDRQLYQGTAYRTGTVNLDNFVNFTELEIGIFHPPLPELSELSSILPAAGRARMAAVNFINFVNFGRPRNGANGNRQLRQLYPCRNRPGAAIRTRMTPKIDALSGHPPQ